LERPGEGASERGRGYSKLLAGGAFVEKRGAPASSRGNRHEKEFREREGSKGIIPQGKKKPTYYLRKENYGPEVSAREEAAYDHPREREDSSMQSLLGDEIIEGRKKDNLLQKEERRR